MKYLSENNLVVFLGFLLFCGVQAAPYSVITDLSSLPLDENNRLASHWLLYSNNELCRSSYESLWSSSSNVFNYRELAPVDGNAANILFGNSNENGDDSCFAVCLVRGTEYGHIPYALPENIHKSTEGIYDFSMSCQTAEIGFILHDTPKAKIYWINDDGKRVYQMDIVSGEQGTKWQQSFLGHKFQVIDLQDNVLLSVTVEYSGVHVIGQFKPKKSFDQNPIPAIKSTLDGEWARSRRVVRTFTDVGFALGKLPLDLFASMSAYYYNNRNHKTLEEWDTKGVFVNWWEAPVYMIGMPWGLKKYWQSRLKTLVEAWSGVELELTDIYGMREYNDGARLLTHVDREETHAASLIVNIAQGNIRSPWKIEIYDFAERLHEIEMTPGDIVYYESARCLHGRMKPLDGGFYVNLFAHYRPIGGDRRWYTKPNPPEAADQLLDIGECHLEDNRVSCSQGRHLPFLNTNFEKLEGPLDLFKYWQKVSPNSSVNEDTSDLKVSVELTSNGEL